MISLNRFFLTVTLLLSVVFSTSTASTKYKRMIVFGDSLSDAGTYTLVAQKHGGGRFTTNPGKLWVHLVADKLNLSMKPNRYEGFGFPTEIIGGFNYAQGGARITLEHPKTPGKKEGSARPLTVQTQYFLKRHHFFKSDLIIVQGGANDVFAQISSLKSGTITPKEAIKNMTTAAVELSILLKKLYRVGATHLYVINLPGIERTPLILGMPAVVRALVEKMVVTFNSSLTLAMRSSGIKVIDFYTFEKGLDDSASDFGFKNITMPACALKDLPYPTSLYCTEKTLVESDADKTYKFADLIHPSTGFSEVIGQFIISQISRQSSLMEQH